MKKWRLYVLCILLGCTKMQAQTLPTPFQKGDRVVFLGNSITEGGHYHSYIWLYYVTRFPESRMQMYSAGTGGDASWNMLERLEEDVYGKKPTVITASFGMNDSGYNEYLRDDAEKFVSSQLLRVDTTFRKMQDIMLTHKDTKVILIGSSPYDEMWQNNKNKPFSGKNETMSRIVEMQKKAASRNGWSFVDFFSPIEAVNKEQQAKKPAFTLTQGDRIHPDNHGNMLMAYFFLKSQGLAGKPIANVCINAAMRKVLNTENCYVSKLKGDKEIALAFNYLAKSLPYPLDTVPRGLGKKHSQFEASEYVPIIEDLNQEILQVKGLQPGNYMLKIDGHFIATFDAGALESGINMAVLYNTPQYQQAVKVMHLNEERWNIEKRFREYAWTEFRILKQKGMLFQDNLAAMDTLRASVHENLFLAGHLDNFSKMMYPEIREAWQSGMDLLVNRMYELAQPVVHRIELVRETKISQ